MCYKNKKEYECVLLSYLYTYRSKEEEAVENHELIPKGNDLLPVKLMTCEVDVLIINYF